MHSEVQKHSYVLTSLRAFRESNSTVFFFFGAGGGGGGVTLFLTLLHLERPKLYTILAFLSAIGLKRATHKGKNLLL